MSVVLSRFDLIKGCVHPKQRPNHTFTQEPLHNQECEYVHTHMHTHLHSSIKRVAGATVSADWAGNVLCQD